MKYRWLWQGLMAMAWIAVVPARVEAQVGLSSGVAQVTLVVRVPPRGSVLGVSAQRETGRVDGVREVAVGVRLSANTGYRLLVRRIGAPGRRIWVRAEGGRYQELTSDGAVSVATDNRAYHGEREVHYRVEAAEEGEPAEPLPVRYEIAINPSL